MDAIELASLYGHVAGDAGADGKDDGIGSREDLSRHLGSVRPAGELHTRIAHEVDATLHDLLGKLHVGNTVGEQATGALVPLVHAHAHATSCELPGKRQAGGTGPHDAHERGGVRRGDKRTHAPAPPVVGEQALVVVDGDRIVMQAEVACDLARRRTHAAGEFREGIGQQQACVRIVESSTVEQVIDLGNEVMERTARRGDDVVEDAAALAKRHAAVHAAARLLALLVGGKR